MKEFTNKACHYLCIRGNYAHHWKYDYCLFQYPGFLCFRNVFETYQNLLHTQLSPILPGDPNIEKIFNKYAMVQINKGKRYVKDHVW